MEPLKGIFVPKSGHISSHLVIRTERTIWYSIRANQALIGIPLAPSLLGKTIFKERRCRYIYYLLVHLLQQEQAVLLMDMFSSVDDKLLFGNAVYSANVAKTPKPSVYRLQTLLFGLSSNIKGKWELKSPLLDCHGFPLQIASIDPQAARYKRAACIPFLTG